MMFFFSFINRKFWWPKKRKFKLFRFFSFIFKKHKRKLRQFYLFRDKTLLVRIKKKKNFYLFSYNWILKRFKKHLQRQFSPYHFIKQNLLNSKYAVKKYNLKLPQLILRFTINNIFLVVLNKKTKVLTYFSSGLCGFSGPTKKTLFALDQLILKTCKFLKQRKIQKIHLNVNSGVFSYKLKSVLEIFFKARIYVKALTYKVNLAHNGIRGRKIKRR